MKILSGINKGARQLSRKEFVRWVGRAMIIILSVLLVSSLILASVFLAYSPGKLQPFLDKDGKELEGSISERGFVNIGGVKQGMFIRGKNCRNPVLLFVHGGPCFSEYFLFDKYPTGLEDDFTVCYWEERGGGLSYNSDVSLDSMTMEQLTSDTIEVTNYLRKRFEQDRIYLAAHSGGTFFAIQVAAKEPELYQAYIGISQITKQTESEKIAYKYLMEQYKAAGNTKMVEKLRQYPILEDDSYVIPFFKSLVRDQAMHEFGVGTMRNMKSLEKDVVLPIMLCEAYTFREKINLWTSKFTFIKKTKLADQLFATDLTTRLTKLEIPVYFFSGAYDLTVNHDLTKAYLQQLEAPVKGFYTFENSAHSPIFEEPDKMMYIIKKDVLMGENKLADKE
ncbi:alpha/beta fold hydrolase [Anaerosolibacter sp.]|uniref:alpha/beta fold hydrolase n=1 Tax=Anaerosolibacter sp. TaxID=1872527 RepID=UPI002637D14D|nr:alpha/beta hydrolase [Anaerosolibacter sp.]